MITGVTVNGIELDRGMVLAEVTILHGRRTFADGPSASSATIIVHHPPGTMPPWGTGDVLVLDGLPGFTGRITDLDLDHFTDADGTIWGRFTVTAMGTLARLGFRQVGDAPWPQETGTERAVHILEAAAVPYRIDTGPDLADLTVMGRDVDAQPALGLLGDLTSDTGAAVFDLPTGEVVYQPLSGRARDYRWRWADYDPAYTWATHPADLTWDGDPPSLRSWISPSTPQPVDLPAGAVLWEPVWSAADATIINHARVGYGGDSPQAAIEGVDVESIDRHGRRYLYLGSQLATEADATARMSHILSTQAAERFALSDVTVILGQLDPATGEQVLELTCGAHVTINGMPQPAPALDWLGIVEGWTFTQWAAGGQITEQLLLALSDQLHSLAVMAWGDYPALYEWADHPGGLTWDTLTTIGA